MKRLGRPPKSLAKTKPPTVVEPVSSRVGGRERKAKKVFDPSENNTPKKRMKGSKSAERFRGENVEPKYKTKIDNKSSSPKTKYSVEEFCSICNKEEKKIKTLVNCNDCNLKAHIECLTTKFEDRKLLETKWRCDNCKTCAICYETEEIGALISCSVCINSYHITCHVPKVNSKIMNFQDWRCTKCPLPSVSKQLTNSQINTTKLTLCKSNAESISNSNSSLNSENSSFSYTSNTTESTTKREKQNKSPTKLIIKEEKIDVQENDHADNDDLEQKLKITDSNEVPDISSWSCQKLNNFMQKIFPYEAKLLQEQDVDGQSLLLMTRTDVLSLGLKLGPALRLYNFIVGLQTRKYDNIATWIY